MTLPTPVRLQQTPSYQSFSTDSSWDWKDGIPAARRDCRLLGSSADGLSRLWPVNDVDSNGSTVYGSS